MEEKGKAPEPNENATGSGGDVQSELCRMIGIDTDAYIRAVEEYKKNRKKEEIWGFFLNLGKFIVSIFAIAASFLIWILIVDFVLNLYGGIV